MNDLTRFFPTPSWFKKNSITPRLNTPEHRASGCHCCMGYIPRREVLLKIRSHLPVFLSSMSFFLKKKKRRYNTFSPLRRFRR
jgi:hypothetical protein